MDMDLKDLLDKNEEGSTRRLKKPKRGQRSPSNKSPPTRIIGGSPVEAGEYPWFARATLSFFGIEVWYGCGGSLVAPGMVMTAAHCGFSNSGVGVQIGALCPPYGPSASDNCGQDVESFDVIEVFDHPGYNPSSSDKDFSLLKLSGSSTIPPVPMDSMGASENYPDGTPLYPIGFGTTISGDSSSSSDILLDVMSPYVNNVECDDLYGFFGPITDAMMCAGDTNNGGEDACQGDSGGPLYDKANDLLVGVTSWGIGCGLANFPGVYARISNQWSDWIEPTICANHSPDGYPDFCEGYTASPTLAPTPTPPPLECEGSDTLLTIKITTDQYANEDLTRIIAKEKASGSGFSIYDVEGFKVGNPYPNNKLVKEEFCLEPGCYKLVMYDEFGDGLCCSWGIGGYVVEYDGVVIKESDFEDATLEITDFGNTC